VPQNKIWSWIGQSFAIVASILLARSRRLLPQESDPRIYFPERCLYVDARDARGVTDFVECLLWALSGNTPA